MPGIKRYLRLLLRCTERLLPHKTGRSGPHFLAIKVGSQFCSWQRGTQQPCADRDGSGSLCIAGSECSSVKIAIFNENETKQCVVAHLVSLLHKYLWVDCSYHGLNPRRIHSLCPQKFLFNKIDMAISFVCIKVAQNTAFITSFHHVLHEVED